MLYKHSEICRHKIPKPRYRVENWREYDAALRERGSLTVWVTLEAIATWRPTKSARRGRSPHYSDIAIETGARLQLAFGRLWWQTEGAAALGDDAARLGHRRSRQYDAVASYRRPVLGHRPDQDRWASYHGNRQHRAEGVRRRRVAHGQARRPRLADHLAIDPDTGEILASALTGAEDGDALVVGPPLDQIAAPIAAFIADSAYDGDPLYRAVAERAPGAVVIVPPCASAVASEAVIAGAPTARDRHIETIAGKGRMGWQKAVGYGRRSLVEPGCRDTRSRSGEPSAPELYPPRRSRPHRPARFSTAWPPSACRFPRLPESPAVQLTQNHICAPTPLHIALHPRKRLQSPPNRGGCGGRVTRTLGTCSCGKCRLE
jgi:hypothetical protein